MIIGRVIHRFRRVAGVVRDKLTSRYGEPNQTTPLRRDRDRRSNRHRLYGHNLHFGVAGWYRQRLGAASWVNPRTHTMPNRRRPAVSGPFEIARQRCQHAVQTFERALSR
jgi:hypothetical protein